MNAYQLDREVTRAFIEWMHADSEHEYEARAKMERCIRALDEYGEAWEARQKANNK